MDLQVCEMFPIILVVSILSMSSANQCCKSLTIASTNLHTKQYQAKVLTSYKIQTDNHGRASYLSSYNDTILYFSEIHQKWAVGKKKEDQLLG